MIKKIKARYECHGNTELELAPGMTGLIGDNDTGKSSINRSIRWAANNDPKGDEMIPWSGKKEARVEIETDHHIVSRRKGPANEYRVDNELFKAVASAVPEEVSRALNIDSTNIQSQVDQFFLLQATPGAVAKRINEVAGISDSDAAIRKTNERISATSKSIKDLQKERKEYLDYLSAHSQTITEATELLDEVDRLDQYLRETEESLTRAKVLLSAILECRKNLDGFPDLEQVEQYLEGLHESGRSLGRKADFLGKATGLSIQLHSVDCMRFDFLERLDLDQMAKWQKEILQKEGRLTAARELSSGFTAIDLAKFDSLGPCEVLLSAARGLSTTLATWEANLDRACWLSAEFHSVPPGKWEVLDILSESSEIETIQSMTEEVLLLEKRLGMLQQASIQAYHLDEAEDQLNSIVDRAIQAGAVCRECGQILRGDDICDR